MHPRAALITLLTSSILLACGASSEDVGGGAGAVQGGARDAAHGYAVGIRSGRSVCSGALVAPNLVLTARHCVASSPPGPVTCKTARFDAVHATKAMAVTTEPSLAKPKRTYAIASVIVPDDDAACGADIALLLLTDPIPRAEAVPATPLVQFPMTARTRVGREVTVIGYGATSATSKDPGVRRVREHVRVSCVPGEWSFGCFGRATDREFATDGSVCGGDSGSGAYEQSSFERGEPLVLGVLSRGLSLGEECADATYTRTDSHADMIVRAAKVAAERGGYPLPAWAKPAPADAGAAEPDASVGKADAGADAGRPDARDAGASAPDAAAPLPATDAGAPPPVPADEEPMWTPPPTSPSSSSSSSTSSSGASRAGDDDEARAGDEGTPAASGDAEASGCAVAATPRTAGLAPLVAMLAIAAMMGSRLRRARAAPLRHRQRGGAKRP